MSGTVKVVWDQDSVLVDIPSLVESAEDDNPWVFEVPKELWDRYVGISEEYNEVLDQLHSLYQSHSDRVLQAHDKVMKETLGSDQLKDFG